MSGSISLVNTFINYKTTSFHFKKQPLTVVMGGPLRDEGTKITIPVQTYFNVPQNIVYAKYVIINSDKLSFTTSLMYYWLRLFVYDTKYGSTVLMPWQFIETKRGVCIEFALFYEAYFISDTFTYVAVKIQDYPYGHVAIIHDSLVYENLNSGYYGEKQMRSWLYSYGKTLTFYYFVYDHGTLVSMYSKTYTEHA